MLLGQHGWWEQPAAWMESRVDHKSAQCDQGRRHAIAELKHNEAGEEAQAAR